VAERLTEVYIFDDSSSDNTVNVAKATEWGNKYRLRVYKTPYNQGYGGNQILGYRYAILRQFDIVVLLHGDGQYAPEALPDLLAPYAKGADVVYGSRFIPQLAALKGGMPLYKFIGNRILTKFQNLTLGAHLTEMHSGYRSYRTAVLKQIPFDLNSHGFDFDADIIGQLTAKNINITEVPIPTFYGDEICHVNGLNYAFRCFKTVLKYRLMKFNLFFDPKYDINNVNENRYTVKSNYNTVHYFVRNLNVTKGSKLLELGGNNGAAMARYHSQRGVDVTCIDQTFSCSIPDPAETKDHIKFHVIDLNRTNEWDRDALNERYETVIALDVLEHLLKPEDAGRQIFSLLKAGGQLYASTANVAFFPVRLMLLFGHFNYGKRGILDLTHTRLFTIASFRRYLGNCGFIIKSIKYFGPPITDELGKESRLMRFLDWLLYRLANIWPALFAYQVLAICERPDSVEDLLTTMIDANN
jgi:glycosyltransferase involved in cell wall biosynthesis